MTVNSFKNIAQTVKVHRKKAKLSQMELAALAGVGKTVIYDIEKGKETVQFDTVLKVFAALNIVIVLKSPLLEQLDEKS